MEPTLRTPSSVSPSAAAVAVASVLVACGTSTPPALPPGVDPAPPAASDTGLGGGLPDSETGDPDVSDPTDTGDAPGDREPGDTPATARPLPAPDTALTVSDAIDPPGDVDWYSVPLSAGDTLWIAVLAELRATPSPLAPRLEVRDSAGSVVHVARGMPLSIGGLDTALAFEAPTDDTFFLGVTAADPTAAQLDPEPSLGGPEHAYSLRLERAPPFEVEPHNDTAADMTAWLATDGAFAYLGDPFIAGWPLWSHRSDTPGDVDLLPWTVRGESSTEAPAGWELWSWSPWPGCRGEAQWTVTSGAPGHSESTVLGSAPVAELHTDPLWQLSRHGLPVLPDLGLLVAAPPGEMWLTVAHAREATGVGTACTGVLAGWTTDLIDRATDLPETSDGGRTPRFHDRGDGSRVALVWGTTVADAPHRFHIPTDPTRPWLHVVVQARGIGSDLDPVLELRVDGGEVERIATSPIDGAPDPDLWSRSTEGATEVEVSVDAESGTGPYLLQVHLTPTALP